MNERMLKHWQFATCPLKQFRFDLYSTYRRRREVFGDFDDIRSISVAVEMTQTWFSFQVKSLNSFAGGRWPGLNVQVNIN